MSFYGTHPAAYADAINKLKLGTNMRNTQYPGSDTDPYANPQDMQTCAVPLAHKAFRWNRDGFHTFKISDAGGNNSMNFEGMTGIHSDYAQKLKEAQLSVPLFMNDGNPYNDVTFPNYKFDTAYETAGAKTTCDVGVTLAPWMKAEGFEPTATTPGDGGARFGYDGACYQPPHCGC